MEIRKFIVLTGLVGILLAGLAPITEAAEDGQFPVFPTVIEDRADGAVSETAPPETITSPAPSPAETGTTVIKNTNTVQKEGAAERSGAGERDNFVTNESGVFSPWGTLKRAFINRAQAGEEGVAFALTSLDAKPTGQGDLRYQIFYANRTADTLRNVSVRVFLPKDIQYLDSDLRPDSKAKGVVVFEIGKIAAGEEGAIQLEARFKKKKAKEAVLSATMAYEDIDHGKHTVTAATNNTFDGKNGGGLSASVLDGVGGIMLWLFVIILIIALAFVTYQYFILQASGRRT